MEIIISSLIESKKHRIFLELYCPPELLKCIWNKPHLFNYTLLWLDYSQYAKSFSQLMINADFFYSSELTLIFCWICLKIALHFSVGQPSISFKIFRELWWFAKFSFHLRWNDGWLLLINMVYPRCFTSCWTTSDLGS